MTGFYKPFTDREPDYQYHRRLMQILDEGELAGKTEQGPGAYTCFGTLPQMVFDLSNGVPLITERALPSWRSAVAELLAFVNGERNIDRIESYGVNRAFWSPYRGMGTTKLGLADPDDMGPGSYGGVFGHYERADGTAFNQFERIIEHIRLYPHVRTHRITNWRADYALEGPDRKVIIAPCHGDLHFRVLNGRLHMRMDQRSGDFPIGVPHNMVQYAALHLMMCQVTNYPPGNFIHSFSDAHVYENQLDAVREMLGRTPKPFPALYLDSSVENLFDFRIEHFDLHEYEPHPAMKVPYAP